MRGTTLYDPLPMDALVAAFRRMGKFAGAGAALAALCLAVGALRILVVLLFGRHFSPLHAHDIRVLAFYVGSFIVAGAIFGLLQPLWKGRLGITVGCMLAGVVAVVGIGIGDSGGIGQLDAVDWVMLPALGMLFGGAMAYGLLKRS